MYKNPDELWQHTLTTLQSRIAKSTYESFIKKTKLHTWSDNELVIETPNSFIHQYLSEKYTSMFKETIRELTGQELYITFKLNEQSSDEYKPVQTQINNPLSSVDNSPIHHQEKTISLSNLNPRYNFANFVVGSHNKFAHAAACRVAEAPGTTYNPLFIYGGVGLGKTHLMQAIGHHLLKQKNHTRVTYISSERFANELINAIRDDSTMDFKNRYRSTDLLLIDDIQFIGGKERTQEEFFHTFNELYEAEKQIVISSDRPPSEISTLEDRLRSRFEMGLITDIQPPDLETRIAILKKKADMDRLEVPDDILHFIATVYKSNVRELEGAFIKLMAYISLTEAQPTVSVAQSVLGNVSLREITPEIIQNATAEYCNLTMDDLKSQSRTKEVNQARQMAIYLCCELTELSTPKIGDLFGGRDHSTILYARDRIKTNIKEDKKLQSDINNIMSRLR